MRHSATFPAGDTRLLKQKLVCWAENFSCAILIDHNQFEQAASEFDCLVAAGALEIIVLPAGKVFSTLADHLALHHDWLFGYLTYDLKNEIEPGMLHNNPDHADDIKFPQAHFFRPRHILKMTGKNLVIESTEEPERLFQTILETAIDDSYQPTDAVVRQRMKKEHYLEKVAKLKQHIRDGDVYEINFCQEFYLEGFASNPVSLFNKLNRVNPAPFATFLKHDSHYLLSSSPERFLMKRGNRICAQPMKGTLSRQVEQNTRTAAEILRNDPKELAENVMIVDLVRNDLARSSVPGSVKVDELFGVYSFATVHQMVSTISGILNPDLPVTDAIRHAFPMGSMTGAPKIKAMQLISEYEVTKRGLFSGIAGYITPECDFDFSVVIRAFILNSNTQFLSFQTGSAITYDSIAENEYEESWLKASALIKTLF